MDKKDNAKLLRIFVGESDKIAHQPLYERIVFDAKKAGLSGATVTRGIMGFGANSNVKSAKLFEISSDLPLIIEIIDLEDKISDFVALVESLFETSGSGGLITIEKAEIISYRHGN